jgi:phosphoglycerate dehydrogenase-like enzyme
MAQNAVIVVEDDPFPRMLQVMLDPTASSEQFAALSEFFAHDLPDFAAWCARVRQNAGALYPAQVRLVSSQDGLRANLPDAAAVVTESLTIGRDELAVAPRLKVVQKYGTILRNIDTAACAARGIQVLTLRRRANIACAEHAFALMLTLAKQLHRITGVVSMEQVTAAGYSPKTFDRRYVPNSGWACVTNLRMLNASTMGIIGLGEIGRELALRANAFGMHVIYFQRTRLAASEEQALQAEYRPLERLLAESDWVCPALPGNPATQDLIGHAELLRMKRGACLVNIARAQIVNRTALIAALQSGHLGGFALDPLYAEPGRADDELLAFDNVIVTPHIAAQPRFNALSDFEDLINGVARALA